MSVTRVIALILLGTLAGCVDPDLGALGNDLESQRARSDVINDGGLGVTPVYRAVPYTQDGARSPFRAYDERLPEAAASSRGSVPGPGRSPESLAVYDRQSLSLVGVIDIGGMRSALIRDPAGRVHDARVGDHVGTEFGEIVAIGDGGITLMERVAGEDGGWTERVSQWFLGDDA